MICKCVYVQGATALIYYISKHYILLLSIIVVTIAYCLSLLLLQHSESYTIFSFHLLHRHHHHRHHHFSFLRTLVSYFPSNAITFMHSFCTHQPINLLISNTKCDRKGQTNFLIDAKTKYRTTTRKKNDIVRM